MHAHQQSLQNTHSLEPFVVLKPRQILTFWVWSRAIDLFYQLPALSNLTLTISWGTMSEQLTDCVWWFARNGISCSYFIPSKAWQVNLEALQTNFELVSPQRHPPRPPTCLPWFTEFGNPVLTHPWIRGWSEPAAINAPVEDEAVQAVLVMNQKHILFPCPGNFQPPYLPQNFPLLPTYLPSYLPPSTHFLLTPSPKLSRALELE